MAIELNKSKPIPEYDRDEYLEKFIPLVFKYAPEFDTFKLRILADKMDLGKDRIIFGNLQNTISDFLIKNDFAKKHEGEQLILTDKGRDKKNGTEPWNRITKYQKIYLPIFLMSVISAFVFGVLNYLSNKEVDFQKERYNLLESDFVHYKDSVNKQNMKTVKATSKLLNDTSQTKNYSDLKTETDLTTLTD